MIVGLGAVAGLWAYEIFETDKKLLVINESCENNVIQKNDTVDDEYFGNEFIQVKHPQKNNIIKSPILISGEANVFEGNVRVRIKDEAENILADTFITASGAYDKLYPFEKEISYSAPASQNGVVEIFEEDMKDGSEINKVIIPVVFGDYTDIKNQTVDWKILNGSFNYTIKYPPEFYVKKGFHGEAEIEYISDQISSVENPASQNMLESFRFSISRRKNIEKDNLNSIYSREINMLAREKIATSVPFEGKVEKVKFGKLEGVKTTRMWELTKQEVKSKEKSIYVYLISDDYAYVLMGNISQFAKQGEFDNLVRVMDKMLNTFKFTEK